MEKTKMIFKVQFNQTIHHNHRIINKKLKAKNLRK